MEDASDLLVPHFDQRLGADPVDDREPRPEAIATAARNATDMIRTENEKIERIIAESSITFN